MRRGLHPLPAHIAMAIASYGRTAVPGADFAADLPDDLKGMLQGIRKYQEFPQGDFRAKLEEVWRAGSASLQTIPGHAGDLQHRPAIVLLPSLVNRSYILDLLPERSLLRYFATQGFAPLLLDWGDTQNDPGQRDLDSVLQERLLPALQHAAKISGGRIHVLGYCMAGTMLAGAALAAQDLLRALIFLAAPWDFHAGGQGLLQQVQFWAPSAFPLMAEKSYLPVECIQTLFAALDPQMTAKKFARFAAMPEDGAEEKIFVAVEDWLNDGVALPAALAQQCIGDWFLKNTPGNGTWAVGGEPVDLRRIKIPALVVASSRDRLVEQQTSLPLQQEIGGARLIDPACGHIGMIAGGQAVETVWAPMVEWLKTGIG